MSSLKKLIAASAIAVALMCGWSQQSNAALMLDVDMSGNLLGVTGLNVGGTLWDVMFMDGTCAALFGGCDMDSDFAFNSQADAEAAAQALLADVFMDGGLGNFDTDPGLTNGCPGSSNCGVFIPFDILNSGLSVLAQNDISDAADQTQIPFGSVAEYNSAVTRNDRTWGVFKNPRPAGIPEPASLALFGTGLATLVFARRRIRKPA